MSNKVGGFEILSEITHSDLGAVYKANDPESGQTVAVKTMRLETLGEQGPELVKRVQEEAEAAKVLNSHNITQVNGVGESDGVFFASLEYVQGNSIATMLARKEGFSIWDLLDIARQTCQGMDHAHNKGVFHYSLEPAKIMVTWDGTVKLLGFGISTMSAFAAQASGAPPEVLHYMSPEQLGADPLDARSNLFSLGAILYEMVTERKAFEGADADQVRQQIVEQMPPPPSHLSPKVHPALNAVIMKALAKSPEDRYQSGQDLVNDLEKCKESTTKAAAKAAQPAQGLKGPAANRPAAPSAPPVQRPVQAVVAPPAVQKPAAPAPPVAKAPVPPVVKAPVAPTPKAAPSEPPAPKFAAAAAASAGGGTTNFPKTPKLDPTAQFIQTCVKATVEAASNEEARMSAAVAEPEPEVQAPKITVDPMMDESRQPASHSRSFSEIDELPPLKEVYVAPPSPPPAAQPEFVPENKPLALHLPAKEEKPKVPPREIAKKAVKEIKKTPPKLFLYSIAGAMAVMLLVMVGIMYHIRGENADEDSGSGRAPAGAAQPRTPAPAPAPVVAQPVVSDQAATVPAPPPEPAPDVSIKPKSNGRRRATKVVAAAPAPVVIPGQLNVSSTPAGAQLHVDGKTEPSWVTPFNISGLAPGQHTVTISKAGFAPESRTIQVTSGSSSMLVVQLAAITATVSVASDPAGAEIMLDGKDTGHVTPAQISIEKAGTHSIGLSKSGYLDESTTANLQFGQTFHYSPTLRKLGNTDDIKSVSRFKKVFGGNDVAGMGVVSIKTNPKGAQIAINRRIYEKLSPTQFYLNPGTYVIDITISGFKDIHRVINVEKDGKVSVEETMERE